MVDLHAHSIYSDGKDTPAQLIQIAQGIGLRALALTDHNSVRGLPEFLEAAKGSGVEPVAGTEFSTEYRGKELHILGLFLGEDSYEPITRMTGDLLRRKEQSNRALVEKLRQRGYDISYEEVLATSCGNVNRAHIAALLTKRGYVSSPREAFMKLLRVDAGLYVPPKRPEAYDVIAFIRQFHAVPVLAHPFLNLTEEELLGFLPQAVEAGLQGMEVYYSTFDEAATERAAQIVRQFGLAPSGGSDYHGGNKPDIAMGCGRGNLEVADWVYEGLLARRA